MHHEASDANKTWTKKVPIVNTAKPMSPASRARKSIVLLSLLLALPAFVRGQGASLSGSEFSVRGGLPGDQITPASAFGISGGFTVWADNITDPSGLGISAHRLDSSLAPVGGLIHVNQTVGGDQQRPKVAMLNEGGAVVVYQSGRSGAQNVLARFLTSSGGFATGELLVNDAAVSQTIRYKTTWTLIKNNRARTVTQTLTDKVVNRQEFNANPTVATLNDGTVVVVYGSSRFYQTNTFGLNEQLQWDYKRDIFITNRTRVPLTFISRSMQDVYFQRFSATGQKIGGETRANQFLEFNQRDASITPLDNGNFALTWVSEQQRGEGKVDIYARIFSSAGVAAGNEFLVSTASQRPCGSPTVAATSGGAFTVAWTQRSEERTGGMDVYLRTFDAGGNPASDTARVNTFVYGDQFGPSIASLGAQQVIVWSSMGQDGSWEGVYGQAYIGATRVGEEFRVNISTPFKQIQPHISSDRLGRALILWSGYAVDSGFDVFGRSYLAP